jgi:hypothetical protein
MLFFLRVPAPVGNFGAGTFRKLLSGYMGIFQTALGNASGCCIGERFGVLHWGTLRMMGSHSRGFEIRSYLSASCITSNGLYRAGFEILNASSSPGMCPKKNSFRTLPERVLRP